MTGVSYESLLASVGQSVFSGPTSAFVPAWVHIPGQADHRFRAKPITHSGRSRSPIPGQADHSFRGSRSPIPGKPIT